ncbi:MAG: hypothetical protein HC831_00345 [Chloroflexia bacterium]|nr:hypothetical protein [Chloroflexia bacterium]
MGSVFVIQADIVEADGRHILGANKPLYWKIDGPGKLVGPEEYISERENHEALFGTMYIDVPVSNVVRSTGHPGQIVVTVESPGIKHSSVSITVVDVPAIPNAGIVERPLNVHGRNTVQKDPKYKNELRNVIPLFKPIDHDLLLKGEDAAWRLSEILQELNPGIDPRGAAFGKLLSSLLQILENNKGQLVADDFNFVVDQLNNQKTEFE